MRPIVLVPACNRPIGDHPFHVAGQKYVDAVRLAGCTPLVVPTAEPDELEPLLDLADGVLLTGSKSNVHPRHFGEAVRDPSLPLDVARDAWTLPLIRLAVRRGQPLLGICRGLQEANVALGGSLHQAVQDTERPEPGQGRYRDHRAPDGPVAQQYGPAHPVHVAPGGLLQRIVQREAFTVNSLHGQAVRDLAPGLQVEARAPDGLVEAFSVPPQHPGRQAQDDGTPAEPVFALCVQWHPEWAAADNPVSLQILQAFGAACRAWQRRRAQVRHHPVMP